MKAMTILINEASKSQQRTLKCEFTASLELASANAGGHWIKRYNTNKRNAIMLKKIWLTIKPKPKPPCTVTIERVWCSKAKQKMYNFDNYVYACKGIRDAIADLLIPGLAAGRADDDERLIRWLYQQTKGEEPKVRITIEER